MLQITEDALRAMANLNMAMDPNWLEIKKWLQESRDSLQKMAAFSIDLPMEKVRFFQGLAWAINDLSIYAEYPKETMEKLRLAKKRTENKLTGIP